MSSLLTEVSARDLRKAATLKERIDELQHELSRILGGTSGGSRIGSTAASGKTRRRMSAAAKARLAEIAKARWKKAKAAGRSRL